MDSLFPQLKIRVAGSAVRTGRPRPPAQLRRVEDRPDPRGRDHRGRVDGELHRRRRAYATRTTDRAVLHLLFDVRLPASATSSGRPPTRAPAGSCSGRRLGGRPCSARGCSTRTGTPRAGVDGAGVSGVRPGLRLRGGDDRPAGSATDVRRGAPTPPPRRLLLPHAVQRELPDAGDARARPAERRDAQGCTAGRSVPRARHGRSRCCSPAPLKAPPWRPPRSWRRTGTSAGCGRRRRTRRCARRR